MATVLIITASPPPAATSLAARLLDLFVSPSEVFEQVVAEEVNLANWRVPMLLACLAGVVLLRVTAIDDQAAVAIQQLTGTAKASAGRGEAMAGGWKILSSLAVCFGAVAGSLWSAFVVWLIGRCFLNVRFSYLKTLEIVGLTSIILVLGSIVTCLLIALSGDTAARPSLSLFGANRSSTMALRTVLDSMSVFHIWTTTILAIGLSKLSGVSFKESAFWVFGYWLGCRMALVILA